MRRCTVLHQAVPPDAGPDEQDVLAATAEVSAALRSAGWEVTVQAMSLDLAQAEAALRRAAPDLVFNLVESLDGADVLAVAAAALLERLGLRYTGSDMAALALAADKRATRRALRMAGVPVPAAPEEGWPGPFIVKHATAHASFGLGPHSVVARLAAPPPPGWYAEAYIDGREFNLALLADAAGAVTALPVAELVFRDWPADLPRILDYAGKWDPADTRYARSLRDFAVPGDLARRLQALALACWRALGLSGYARIDLRMDAGGVAYAIDVNANPCLSGDAGFMAAAAQAGLSPACVIGRITAAAVAPPPPPQARPRASAALSLRYGLREGDDIGALCRATGFFNPSEVAVAEELAAEHRAHGPACGYHFLVADGPAGLAGYACYGPTPATRESWDLYWIAVHPACQGGGLGRALVDVVVSDMAAGGGRRLYAETSSRPQYAPTRAFYAAAGFTLQAAVADFYAPGDGKQIWLRVARHD